MYGSLGFLALAESRQNYPLWRLHLFLLSGILALSATIEVLQATVVAARAAEWYDLLANFLGLVLGYIAHRFIGGWKIFRFLRS